MCVSVVYSFDDVQSCTERKPYNQISSWKLSHKHYRISNWVKQSNQQVRLFSMTYHVQKSVIHQVCDLCFRLYLYDVISNTITLFKCNATIQCHNFPPLKSMAQLFHPQAHFVVFRISSSYQGWHLL